MQSAGICIGRMAVTGGQVAVTVSSLQPLHGCVGDQRNHHPVVGSVDEVMNSANFRKNPKDKKTDN